MRYYAKYSETGELLVVGTGFGGVEITEAEHKRLGTEICDKAELVNRLYAGEITIADVPTEWQEEIQRRVDELVAKHGTADQQEISDEEALNIILGGDSE